MLLPRTRSRAGPHRNISLRAIYSHLACKALRNIPALAANEGRVNGYEMVAPTAQTAEKTEPFAEVF